VSYSLTGDAGGRFAIDSLTGVVTVADGALLNFEAAASHGITVQASDGVGGTSAETFIIAVTNVAPTTPADTDGAANTVAEGSANGTTVGITVLATDPNGPAVLYSLTDNAGGRFAINSTTGVVTVANGTLLDFESATSHDITVQASDGAGGTSAQTLTIALTNVAPTIPVDSNATINSVAEGAATGTTVGITAFATDPGGPAAVYSLTDNAGGRFAIDSATGVVTVADGTLIDFESLTSHAITVLAFFAAGETSTQSFTIAVTDVSGVTIVGSKKADVIDATNTPVGQPLPTSEADVIFGNKGNDDLSGLGGNDILDGGKGNDFLRGGGGDDVLRIAGSDGKLDVFDGGSGTDTLQVLGTKAVTLAGFNAAASSIEIWEGNGKEVKGTSGDDIFDLSGLTSMTALRFVASDGGNDILIGSDFADDLRGGSGVDRLDGRGGNDFLTGGAGRDTFVFADGYGADTVTDYKAGQDIYDFTGVGGVNDFGDLHLTQFDPTTVLIDFDGVPGGDTLAIQKATIALLTANQADFLFA
jgi:Ca2+-binding RTX toxin-like protein